MDVREMFQNMLPIHSSHSLQELALLTEVKKAFLNSLCHTLRYVVISPVDRVNVETFTVYKHLKCLPAMGL